MSIDQQAASELYRLQSWLSHPESFVVAGREDLQFWVYTPREDGTPDFVPLKVVPYSERKTP